MTETMAAAGLTPAGIATGFFFLGLIFGSFANVIILRLPAGKSVLRPRSHCPKCETRLSWLDLIPVLSWLALRGKCRKCGAEISIQYPLVELITALVFAGCFLTVGWKWYLLEVLWLSFGLVVVTFIDLDHRIIPDVFSLSGIVIGLVGALANPERDIWAAVAGVLMGGGFLWAVAYLYYVIRKDEGMGGGDIKLLAWIGAVLGWPAIPFVILVSSVLGSFVGIAFALRSKEGLKTAIPFGPYLAGAALIYVFGGHELAFWYLRLFLPGLEALN